MTEQELEKLAKILYKISDKEWNDLNKEDKNIFIKSAKFHSITVENSKQNFFL